MRFDKAHIALIAKDFLVSSQAKIWPFVQDDIRDALIDQVVMGCVRMASAVEACAPFAPDELLDVRAAVVSTLDVGIPMGGAGRRRLIFDRAAEARREAEIAIRATDASRPDGAKPRSGIEV